MAQFLVEQYVAGSNRAAVEPIATSARLAAEALTREGTRVRYVRSIFVPDDETCFYLYEAASVDAGHQAATRAALRYERVAEAQASHESSADGRVALQAARCQVADGAGGPRTP